MESLDLTRFAAIALPRFVKVKQHFEKGRIGDIAKEVRTQLAPHLTQLQGKKIAIGIPMSRACTSPSAAPVVHNFKKA